MNNLTNIIIPLFVIFCTHTNLSAQSYIPGNGWTVFKSIDGGLVIYEPITEGAIIEIINGNGKTTGTVDCQKNPTLCKEILEAAADENPIPVPEEPAEGGDDEKPTENTTESGPSARQVWKEYLSYSKRNKGKMYFRSKSGKWSVVKDWQTMHKKILASVNKR